MLQKQKQNINCKLSDFFFFKSSHIPTEPSYAKNCNTEFLQKAKASAKESPLEYSLNLTN